MDIEKLENLVHQWWSEQPLPKEGVEITVRFSLQGVQLDASPKEMLLDELLSDEKFIEIGVRKFYPARLRYVLTDYLGNTVREFINLYSSPSGKISIQWAGVGPKSEDVFLKLLQHNKFIP